MPFLKYIKYLKLKFRVFLAGHTELPPVTDNVTKMAMCLTMTGHFLIP